MTLTQHDLDETYAHKGSVQFEDPTSVSSPFRVEATQTSYPAELLNELRAVDDGYADKFAIRFWGPGHLWSTAAWVNMAGYFSSTCEPLKGVEGSYVPSNRSMRHVRFYPDSTSSGLSVDLLEVSIRPSHDVGGSASFPELNFEAEVHYDPAGPGDMRFEFSFSVDADATLKILGYPSAPGVELLGKHGNIWCTLPN